MTAIEIGRLLRAGTTGCVIGCRVNQLTEPAFGCLVRIPLEADYQIFGMIHDIRIDDDGLVRQLVTADAIPEAVLQDNRLNRNVPVEISVLFAGYERKGRIYHLLPPRPPLSLDVIYLCEDDELCRFTGQGRFGYFRHLLRDETIPIGELLAAHLQQARDAHSSIGDAGWMAKATQELITLLRDDYPKLMTVLGAIADCGN